MIEVTTENELNSIVYQKVKKGEYPQPTPTTDYSDIQNQIDNLKNERIQRPPTKQEYFALLNSLNLQVETIKHQNEQTTLDNQKARQAVDDKFLADIETAKKDPENIRNAEIAVLVYKKSIEESVTKLAVEGKVTTKEKDDYIAKFAVTGVT
jgi:hypothetical protein